MVATCGHQCVQAWLGFGEVLFLGFGDAVLTGRTPEGRRKQPCYELSTHFAYWSVEVSGSVLCCGEAPRPIAQAAAETLVGRAALLAEAQFDGALEIRFAGDCLVRITPFTDKDMSGDEEAWALRLPDGHRFKVSRSGEIQLVYGGPPKG